jgi:anti-anti-sigma regulatory factor
MEDNTTPVFFVDPRSDPVAIRVRGRASMYNSHLVKRFIDRSVEEGKRRFAIDFSGCHSLDSTFLGTIKGIAQRLQALKSPGSIVFCGLAGRNLENVRNVGLDCLAILDCDLASEPPSPDAVALEGPQVTREEFKALVTQAHQVLAEDPRVKGMFQDVNTFLGNDPGPGR